MPIFLPVSLMNNNRGVLGINMGRLWGEVDLLGEYFVEILKLVKEYSSPSSTSRFRSRRRARGTSGWPPAKTSAR
jgi:hypothetical protein